jgi:octaprenyl-diphosphate synthase
MSEGELHQIQKSRKLDMDEETYMTIIGDKTASLLATCCEIGAASSTIDQERHRRLREFGENVGLAFQIRDDVLDYVGRRSITGKPTGLDLNEKKLTLPLIHALREAPRSEGKEVLGMIRHGGKSMKVQKVIDFVKEHGGLEYAGERAHHYASLAKAQLESFPASPSKSSLTAFAEFVVTRNK